MKIQEIRFYRATGEYGFLSNLFRCPIEFEGRQFNCSEAAYQYGKPKDKAVAEWIISAPKPHLMAVAAHGLFVFDVDPHWAITKVPRMRRVLWAKFTQHPELTTLLLDTNDARLVEESNIDAFWGLGKKGNGKNKLGELLMELRDALSRHVTTLDLGGEGPATNPARRDAT